MSSFGHCMLPEWVLESALATVPASGPSERCNKTLGDSPDMESTPSAGAKTRAQRRVRVLNVSREEVEAAEHVITCSRSRTNCASAFNQSSWRFAS